MDDLTEQIVRGVSLAFKPDRGARSLSLGCVGACRELWGERWERVAPAGTQQLKFLCATLPCLKRLLPGRLGRAHPANASCSAPGH